MADMRIQHTDRMVGNGSPLYTDTLNRLTMVAHNSDGSHKSYVDCSQYDSLATALANVPVTTEIVVSSVETLAAGTIVRHQLVMPLGGCINIVSGEVIFRKAPKAGLYKIFSGLGNVAFIGVGSDSLVNDGCVKIYPEWWGADPCYSPHNDIGGDSTNAFKLCATVMSASQIDNYSNRMYQSPCLVLSGCYKITSTITFRGNTVIQGSPSVIWVSSPAVVYNGDDNSDPMFQLVGLSDSGPNGSCRISGINFLNKSSTNGAYAIYIPKIYNAVQQSFNSVYLQDNRIGGFDENWHCAFADIEYGDDVEISGNVLDDSGTVLSGVRFGVCSNVRVWGNNFFYLSAGITFNTAFDNVSIQCNNFHGIRSNGIIFNSTGLDPATGLLPFISTATVVGNTFYGPIPPPSGPDIPANLGISFIDGIKAQITFCGNLFAHLNTCYNFESGTCADLKFSTTGDSVKDSTTFILRTLPNGSSGVIESEMHISNVLYDVNVTYLAREVSGTASPFGGVTLLSLPNEYRYFWVPTQYTSTLKSYNSTGISVNSNELYFAIAHLTQLTSNDFFSAIVVVNAVVTSPSDGVAAITTEWLVHKNNGAVPVTSIQLIKSGGSTTISNHDLSYTTGTTDALTSYVKTTWAIGILNPMTVYYTAHISSIFSSSTVFIKSA